MPSRSMLCVAALCAVLLLQPACVTAVPSSKIAAKSFIQRNGNSKQLVTKKPIVEKTNNVDDIAAHIQKTINRLINGLKSIPKNFLEAERLKKLRKAGGNEALTYAEYGFLEKANEDFSKVFRMLVTIPFSPEFFFYSYILFPAMARTNPFAWSSMPSGFDADPEDLKKRISTLEKRRIQTLVSALVALKGETFELEAGNDNKIINKKNDLIIIEKALRTSNIRKSIEEVESFFMQDNDKKMTAMKLKLTGVPGSIVKGCCRSIGVEGLPNIPLINKLNIGELSKYCDKVRDSDEFLMTTGTNSLQEADLQKACHDRCIRVTGQSKSQLRAELDQWLDICCAEVPLNRGARRVLNDQNRRLALMAFNVAKEAKVAEFGTIYKVLA